MKFNKFSLSILTIFLTLGLFSCVKTAPIENTEVIDLENSANYKNLRIRIINPGDLQKGKESIFTNDTTSAGGEIVNFEWRLFKGKPESSDLNAKIIYEKESIKMFADKAGFFKHKFKDTGKYKLTLKATDEKGDYRTVFAELTVGINSETSDNSQLVYIKITEDDTNHYVGKKSTFRSKGSKTFSQGATISSYKWVLYYTEDALNPQQITKSEINFTGNNFEFTPDKKGDYTLSLTIIDSKDERNTETVYFRVNDKPRDNSEGIDSKITKLDISITGNTMEGKQLSLRANVTSTKQVSRYYWEFYAPNATTPFKTEDTGTNTNVKIIFDKPGLYSVKLRVELSTTEFKSLTKDIDIKKSDENSDDAEILTITINKPAKISLGTNNFSYAASIQGQGKQIDNNQSTWTLFLKDSQDIYRQESQLKSQTFNKKLVKDDYGKSYKLSLKVQSTDGQTFKTESVYFDFADRFAPEVDDTRSKIIDETQNTTASKSFIKRGYTINIWFDERIDIDTILASNIKLVRSDSGKEVGTNIRKPTGTFDHFNLYINEKLEDDINYTLLIKNVEDLSGNKTDIRKIYTTANLSTSGNVIFVRTTGNDTNNGGSWENSVKSIKRAIQLAQNGNMIFVAAGEYEPSSNTSPMFNLKTGVRLYGGFPNDLTGSNSATSFSKRDVVRNQTILKAKNAQYNLSKIVIANNVQNSLLDGFVLQDLSSSARGATAFDVNNASNLSINNCIFRNNKTTEKTEARGSAIRIDSSTLKITNSTFLRNSAKNYGGALYFASKSTARVINSKFNSNTGTKGGAIYNDDSTIDILDSSFFGNSAVSSDNSAAGGALFLGSRTNVEIINSSFNSNHSDNEGAAIYNDSASNDVLNSTFANHTGQNASTYFTVDGNQNISIQNSLFWSNKWDIKRYGENSISVYSNIRLDNSMVKKSDLDSSFIPPGYVQPPSSNKPPIGDWQNEGYFKLTEDSAAINTGKDTLFTRTPQKDQLGNNRIVNGQIDIGAVEKQN